jgi:HEAT repeat protein
VRAARLAIVLAVGAAAAVGAEGQDWQRVIADLRDPSATVRLRALEQLNAANYVPAAPYVAPLVTDPDDFVQVAAIDTALTFFLNEPVTAGRSGSRALEAFNAGPLVRSAAREPSVLVDQLITATADRTARVRFDAVHALGVIAEAVSAEDGARLASALEQPDPVMRAATARVLGRLHVSSAGDALVAALNDRSELVQQFAADALGRLRYLRAVQALTDRVTYYGKGDRANEALLALARIGHGSSLSLLRARLADPDPAARRAAVEGVGRLRDTASLDAVRRIAGNDASNEVRVAALFALDALGEPQGSALAVVVGRPQIGAQAADYLLELGRAAGPATAGVMATAADPAARAALAHLIGYIGGPADAPALELLSRDADARVANAAADALQRLRR